MNIIIKGEQQIKKIGWNVVATSRTKSGIEKIREILAKFEIGDILYHPNFLIEKNNTQLFIIFSEKKTFPISKGKVVSGIDWYKYSLAQYIEAKTGIQVGILMYNYTDSRVILRQMNQLPTPTYWFKTEGSLLEMLHYHMRKPSEKRQNRLDKIFKNPPMTENEKKEIEKLKKDPKPPFLDFVRYYDEYPELCYRDIKGKHRKIRTLAIWDIEEFEQKKLTIQKQLI